MSEKSKKVVMIVLMLLGSGFFIYSGFSMLAEDSAKKEALELNSSK